MSNPPLQSEAERGRGTAGTAVEGATPHTSLWSAPSTILRMVPLPRKRGRIQAYRRAFAAATTASAVMPNLS